MKMTTHKAQFYPLLCRTLLYSVSLYCASLIVFKIQDNRANPHEVPTSGPSSEMVSTGEIPAVPSEYLLDALSRETSPRGRVQCPKVDLVMYKGTHIKYHKPTRVHPAFRERLERFELLVKEVAREIYGRAPHKIRHLGTYNCRRIGGYPNLLSEHSFGNGIDVASFTFSRLKRGDSLPEGVPRSLRRGFTVDMLKHWSSKRAGGGLHKRFLHTLGRRLIASQIFRVLLGPSFPGHKNHFHLDCAPYELISIFK